MAKFRRLSGNRILLPSLPEGLFLAASAVFLFLFLAFSFHFQGESEARALSLREEEVLSLHADTARAIDGEIAAARENSSHFYLTSGEMDALLTDFTPPAPYLLFRESDGASFGVTDLCSPSLASSLLSAAPGSGARFASLASDREEGSPSGKPYFYACSLVLLNGENYRLLTLTDASPFRREMGERRAGMLLLSLLLALLVGGLLGLTARGLLRQSEKTSEALEALAEGEYDLRLSLRLTKEGRRLSAAYNRAVDSMEESMKALRDSSDSRKRFAGSMAHEMKTPLTSILCMADILRIKREVSPEERRELAGVVVEEAKRMRALSSKLLELASAESGSLDKERISVSSLLREVAAVQSPVLALRGLRLLTASDGDVFLWGDRELLKSLLCNLLDNAAKASERGKTVRLASTVRRRGKKAQLLIAVADEGIGMTREETLLATEPFYMADKVRSRKAGGAGLGLALCKEIADQHNATLSIRSQKGKGTTVVLRMPLEEEEGPGGADAMEKGEEPPSPSPLPPENSPEAPARGSAKSGKAVRRPRGGNDR